MALTATHAARRVAKAAQVSTARRSTRLQSVVKAKAREEEEKRKFEEDEKKRAREAAQRAMAPAAESRGSNSIMSYATAAATPPKER